MFSLPNDKGRMNSICCSKGEPDERTQVERTFRARDELSIFSPLTKEQSSFKGDNIGGRTRIQVKW